MIGLAAIVFIYSRKSVPDFKNLKPIVAGIQKAQKVVLFEGLPHQGWEHEVLTHELKTQKTLERHGFPFYQDLLPLDKEDARALTEVASASGTFLEFKREKDCGGFHPDYCVEWHNASEVYRILFCLNCQEVKCYGPLGDTRCDISPEAYKTLAAILAKYHNRRPARK